MKTQPAIAKAKSPPQALPEFPLPEATDPAVDSLSLSPERIKDGESITSHVLREILVRDQRDHHLRHWGINE